jgi:deoxyribonuclease-4
MTSLIGIHISNIRNIINHDNKNIKLFQFFVSATTDYTKTEYQQIINYIKNKKIRSVIHASYSINLARKWKSSDWWIQQLIGEIKICSTIGSFGIIIHTGKQLDLSIAEALNNMYTSLLYVHQMTLDEMDVRLIIETPAGQGTETLTKIEDFCKFMNKFYTIPKRDIQNRFGMCIDTCHVFAAGNDIRTSSTMSTFFSIIDNMIGINKVKVCHLNDSRGKLGSKLDRHEPIGRGEIGKDALIKITKFMESLEIPVVLETCQNTILDDYKILKSANADQN